MNWLRRLRRLTRGAPTSPPPRPNLSPVLDDDGKPLHRCPRCNGQLRFDLTCHTYGWNDDGTGGKACMPCDSAWEFWCAMPDDDGDLLEDGCGWSYTWGLNPRNPRAAANEQRRPPWIPEGSRPPW